MSLFKQKMWAPVLVPLDPGFNRIPFQFVPEELEEKVDTTWAEASALNREDPILQWSKGNLKSVTFQARLFAETGLDDITPILNKLKAAVQRDSKLKRPPIWTFVWGRVIDIQCVVASVGGIKYDILRSDGTVRGASCQISLHRYEPFDLKVSDPDARNKDTFYRVVREGDLWEHLAGRQYGDPRKGEFLRRLNPDQPTPVVGRTILMPDVEKLFDVVIAPDSLPLARTEAGIKLRREMFSLRARSRVSTILTKV